MTPGTVAAGNELPAQIVGEPNRNTVLLTVAAGQDGEVRVRWRIPPHPRAWAWRCAACETKTTTADCAHTFAAGMHLARVLLGLNPVGVAAGPSRQDGTA